MHTTSALKRDRDDDDDSPKGWFSRLKKTAQPEQSHSMALSSKETVYEIQCKSSLKFHSNIICQIHDYENRLDAMHIAKWSNTSC